MVLLLLACASEAEAPICPAYSGFSTEGRAWTWERFLDDSQATARIDTLNANEVVVLGDQTTETFRCDEAGLWAVGKTTSEADVDRRWEFDPPYLFLPANLTIGDAWTRNEVWHYSDTTGARETASATEQVEVLNEGATNVAAGAFTTLELHILDDDAHRHTEYRDATVGVVLDDDAQLMTVED